MITSLPPHIYSKNAPATGNTLYTSQPIPPGKLIFRVERPLVAALDSGQLGCTCEGCYLSLAEGATVVRKDEAKRKVKMCAGCKVVGYCCKVRFLICTMSRTRFLPFQLYTIDIKY